MHLACLIVGVLTFTDLCGKQVLLKLGKHRMAVNVVECDFDLLGRIFVLQNGLLKKTWFPSFDFALFTEISRWLFFNSYQKGMEKLEGFYKEIDIEFFNSFHNPTTYQVKKMGIIFNFLTEIIWNFISLKFHSVFSTVLSKELYLLLAKRVIWCKSFHYMLSFKNLWWHLTTYHLNSLFSSHKGEGFTLLILL